MRSVHTLKRDIGLRIREVREKKFGLARGAMTRCAESAGFARQDWSKMERGKTIPRSIDTSCPTPPPSSASTDPPWSPSPGPHYSWLKSLMMTSAGPSIGS